MDFETLVSTALEALTEQMLIDRLVNEDGMTPENARRFLHMDLSVAEHTDEDFDLLYHTFLKDCAEHGYLEILTQMVNCNVNRDLIRKLFRIALHDGEISL